MSENSATRVLEDGQVRASDLRPLLAAMTAARDGNFTRVPETGHGLVAELIRTTATASRWTSISC